MRWRSLLALPILLAGAAGGYAAAQTVPPPSDNERLCWLEDAAGRDNPWCDTSSTTTTSTLPATTTTQPSTTTSTSLPPQSTTTSTTAPPPPPPAPPFPIAEWYEALQTSSDLATDQAIGINTYIMLAGGGNLVPAGTRYFARETDWWNRDQPQITGWELTDEADITYRYDVTGGVNLINSQINRDSDKTFFANFSKGVLFGPTDWLSDSDASRFVNIPRLDVTSVDAYWFMDPDICQHDQGGIFVTGVDAPLSASLCRRAANYGLEIDRMRKVDAMDGSHRPVWGFVELGNYEANGKPPPTPAQVRAAVWHMLIAGAEGIEYFPHHRGSQCPETYHVLRESCFAALRSTVTAMNGQIQQLRSYLAMPVAAQPVSGPVRARMMGDTIIAGATAAGGGTATFTVSGSTVDVLFEGRSIPVVNGRFSDTFTDGNTIHIYRVKP